MLVCECVCACVCVTEREHVHTRIYSVCVCLCVWFHVHAVCVFGSKCTLCVCVCVCVCVCASLTQRTCLVAARFTGGSTRCGKSWSSIRSPPASRATQPSTSGRRNYNHSTSPSSTKWPRSTRTTSLLLDVNLRVRTPETNSGWVVSQL